jgi:hypothetical protein
MQLHVDFDFQWTGSDPASEFKLIAKLGQGYADIAATLPLRDIFLPTW